MWKIQNSFRAERTELLHYGFLLFDTTNVRMARALVKEPRKFVQLVQSTDCINLDATVIFVAHPSPKTDTIGVLLHEPAEADPLHSPSDEPAPRFDRRPSQFFGSATPTDSISAWTAERNEPIVNGLGRSLKPFSTT